MNNKSIQGLVAPKKILLPNNELGVMVVACTAYGRHGEYYTGNLLVIEYTQLVERPSVYNFGQNSFSDWANKSMIFAKNNFGLWAKQRLAIPDMVLEYPADIDLVGMFNQAP